jgi:phage-related protein
MANPVFIWTPSWTTAERSAPRVRKAELGPLQSLATAADGSNADLKTWNFVFENIIPDTMNAIDAFLEARNASELFEYTNPRGKLRYYVCENWDTLAVAEDIWTIRANFREVPLT